MQGWRKRQEDAHISAVSQGDKKDIDVFGVFDGHGGKEISKFVSNHFTEELKNNKNLYTDMSLALKETFIKMDEIMQTTESIEEIKKYARMSKEEDEIQSKNEFFCGIYITTNKRIVENNEEKQRNILLGVTARENVDGELVIRVNNENKVIIGMGCCANEQYGISAIYLYQVDKVVFSLYQTYGIRQLRAKIKNKNNKEFEESLEKLKPKLNPEQKLLSDVCGLPEAVFFSILKYTMPY